jgi:hypothetical protein
MSTVKVLLGTNTIIYRLCWYIRYVDNKFRFLTKCITSTGIEKSFYPISSSYCTLIVTNKDIELASQDFLDSKKSINPKEWDSLSMMDKIYKIFFVHDGNITDYEFVEIDRDELYNENIEMFEEIGYCSGVENYSRYLSSRRLGEQPATLIDYFPDDFLVIIDESHMTIPQIRGMYRGDRSRKETLVNYGFRLPSALDNRPLRFHEFEDLV